MWTVFTITFLPALDNLFNMTKAIFKMFIETSERILLRFLMTLKVKPKFCYEDFLMYFLFLSQTTNSKSEKIIPVFTKSFVCR